MLYIIKLLFYSESNVKKKRENVDNQHGEEMNNIKKRPEFIVIGNLYDILKKVTDEYGFEKVILHLGEVARVSVTRGLANRIWGILNIGERHGE